MQQKASTIVNQAITSLSNIEAHMAIGMAKAALIVDEDCECAKLVIAAAATNNQDWVQGPDKLQKVNVKSLTKKSLVHTFITPNDNLMMQLKLL